MIEKISLVILTCDKRYGSVGATIKSVLESDYRGDISIVNDERYATSEDGMSRANEAFRGLLENFCSSDKEYLLYLEDDVIVNKHIQHNLLQEIGNWGCIVLCNWGEMRCGGQGLLLNRDVVKRLLSEAWLAPWDGVLYSMLDREKIPTTRYSPSLVQHIDGVSAISGIPTPYYAIDFDADWRYS